MEQMITSNIGGLKCDNPKCDYIDDSIKLEQYEEYINHPCPTCGSPLLTQADYDQVQNILRVMNNMVNGLPHDAVADTANGQQAKISFELNGTGDMEMNIEEIGKKTE